MHYLKAIILRDVTNKEAQLAVLTSDALLINTQKKEVFCFMSSFCKFKFVISLLDCIIVHSTTPKNGTLWNPIHVHLKINPSF